VRNAQCLHRGDDRPDFLEHAGVAFVDGKGLAVG